MLSISIEMDNSLIPGHSFGEYKSKSNCSISSTQLLMTAYYAISTLMASHKAISTLIAVHQAISTLMTAHQEIFTLLATH